MKYLINTYQDQSLGQNRGMYVSLGGQEAHAYTASVGQNRGIYVSLGGQEAKMVMYIQHLLYSISGGYSVTAAVEYLFQKGSKGVQDCGAKESQMQNKIYSDKSSTNDCYCIKELVV